MSDFILPKKKPEPTSDTALIIVDLQRYFCDPEYGRGNYWTDGIARKTASLVSAFRDAGARIYFVRYPNLPEGQDFHHVEPAATDVVFNKYVNSVFRDKNQDLSPDFHGLLARDGIKNLMFSGVNIQACVWDSAEDAKDSGRYNVTLINNLSARGRFNPRLERHYCKQLFQEFSAKGIAVKSSAAVLRELTARQTLVSL